MISISTDTVVALIKYFQQRFLSNKMGVASLEYALFAGLIAMTIFVILFETRSSLMVPLLTIYFDTYLALLAIYQGQ